MTFSTVGAMTSAAAATLPVKSIAVCSNYYNTDGIYTIWIIVSGDVSDGVSRLGIGNGVTTDRTAILLSERNADTLGLRGASYLSLERKLLTMCKNNYKYLKITSNGLNIPMPSAADVGSASITPLAIYGTNKKISTTLTFKAGECNTVESISTLSLTISGQGQTTFTSRCAIHDCDVSPQIGVTFNYVDFDTVRWRADGLTFAPIDTDSRPMVKNCRISVVVNPVKVIATAANPRGIVFINNSFYRERGAELVSSWAFLDIDGNAMPITLRDNFCYAGSEASAATIMVLANCKNFVETGKVLICEGNRNDIGGASHPYTMFTGDIPSDIVYVNNSILSGNTYALSDIPTIGSFKPARVMGVTHPIGYLRTDKNRSIVHGTPLTLTYPTVSYWTADEDGGISLSSDKNALYKVTFKGTVRVSGQASAGNVKFSLSGLETESRTFSVSAELEYAPISFEFYWGNGGGFTVTASSETENMSLIIREAELLIERLK